MGGRNAPSKNSLKTLGDLKAEKDRILEKAKCYEGCKDGSYKAALQYYGYYDLLKQIEEIEQSENLQDKSSS